MGRVRPRTADELVATIGELIERWAPDNSSEFPFAQTQVYDLITRHRYWWVAIHIRRPGQHDFTIEAEHEDRRMALYNAFHKLSRFQHTARQAEQGDRRFKLEPEDIAA